MVKWDATTDQILLLKILETSKINVDVKAISDAWPADMDKPTPRAVTEHLVKIRKDVKSSIGISNTKGTASPAGPATPQKRAPRGSVKKPSPKKNENGKQSLLDGFDDDSEAESPNTCIKRSKTTDPDRVSLPREYNTSPVKVEGPENSVDDWDRNPTPFGGDGAGYSGGLATPAPSATSPSAGGMLSFRQSLNGAAAGGIEDRDGEIFA